MKKRTVEVKMLPDGSGRMRIHWFEIAPDGPASTAGGIIHSNMGPVEIAGMRGRIACMPRENNIGPREIDGVIHVVQNSDDARAVTCPECMATERFKKRMLLIEEMVDHPERFQPSAAPAPEMQGV
jgi:hypothetical protein